MQLNLGQKIRELRRRDGRKQEDLAKALGVTCQTVSRWEVGGGYPDMEIIPAIANYFNVSIDELFCYSKDRQEKLKAVLDKTETQINAQGDMTECVETLRDAAEEFPSEPKILFNLGYALNIQGWKKHGAKSYTKDDSDYTYEDKEYNSGNIYWQEAIKVYERALSMDISPEERDAVTLLIVTIYAKMGYNEKAKALALKQNSIINSKEILLTHATEAEERDKYQGEAIISLLTELKNVLCNSVCTKISLFTKTDGIKLLVDLAHVYETIFSDGKCGIAHLHIRELYLHAAVFEARFGNTEHAFEYFKKGFEHNKIYNSIRYQGVYQYTAPLVSKVTFLSENFPSVPESFWKGWIEVLPDGLREQLKSDSQFAECFEKI
ncbi:MAG: helix-turn-helix transcriptional regulator [Ruminococcaceae bacterium]|nr:helix-turn-helix transcriptional regulator [Oscillospiraceae bacterium]